MSELSERLRRLREEKKPIKSMAVVSELCEKGAVGRYERGECIPGMEALVALADYYEVSLDYLIGRSRFR